MNLFSYLLFILIGIIIHVNHMEAKKDIADKTIDDIINHPGSNDNIISGNNIHNRVQTNSDVHIEGIDNPSKDHKEVHTLKTIKDIESENMGLWKRFLRLLGF